MLNTESAKMIESAITETVEFQTQSLRDQIAEMQIAMQAMRNRIRSLESIKKELEFAFNVSQGIITNDAETMKQLRKQITTQEYVAEAWRNSSKFWEQYEKMARDERDHWRNMYEIANAESKSNASNL